MATLTGFFNVPFFLSSIIVASTLTLTPQEKAVPLVPMLHVF